MLFELFLMGSGQDLPLPGGLTMRWLFFFIGVGASIVMFVRSDDFPKAILTFLLVYTIQMLIGWMLAFTFDSEMSYLMVDFKPLLYFYIVLFFYYIMTSELMIKKVVDIMLLCVKIMTVLYLIYMTLTDILGLFSMTCENYHTVDDSGSFMFRGVGSSLFYKGFVYLPIGALGFFWRKQYVWMVLSIIAIYFTYTRGLYVLLAFGLLAFYLKTHEVNIIKIVGLMLVVLLLYEIADVFEVFTFDDTYLENREESDSVRLITTEQVFDRITWWSFLFGHGFGQGVPERPAHMEISYLDIFHHQGIFGLSFWLALFYAILKYGNTAAEKYKEEAAFFMTAAMMIYLQSCFNPYINNSIGMSITLLAFVICYRLSQDEYFTNRSTV
jgi:hypothetical protein